MAAGIGLWWTARSGPDRTAGKPAPPSSGPAPEQNSTAKPGAPLSSGKREAGTAEKPPAPAAGGGAPDAATAALLKKMNAVLDDEPDADTRTAQWNALLAGMRPRDALAVRGIFLENDKRGRWFIPEWVSFWKKYGELDAAAALDEWKATGNPTDPDSPGRIVAAGIKARGLEEAKMLMTRGDVRDSPSMTRELLKAVARQAPEQSLRFMMESVPGELRAGAAQAIVETGIDRDGLEQAPQLMRSLAAAGADEASLQAAFSSLLTAAWRGGAARAQEFALAQVSQPWCTGSALATVAAQLTNQNAATAMDFITKLPNSLAGESIELAVGESARLNPDDIGLWLKDHGTAPHYDSITSAYCRTLYEVDPAAAEAWAGTIKDPVLRDRALSSGEE